MQNPNPPNHSIADQVTQPPKDAFDLYETTIAFWPLNDRNPAYNEASAMAKNRAKAAEASRARQIHAAQQQSAYAWLIIVTLMIATALSLLFLVR